jgi:monoterpene epsilon-lactone hydrolase
MTEENLSAEASAFIDATIHDDSATDFGRIVQIRNEVRQMSAPCAERAIARYDLVRQEIVINGVECERVTSRNSSLSRGTLVYLFGGGFIVGCPYSDLAIIGALAQWCQVEVIAPKYRLAPEHPAPAAADDCLAVWREVSSKSSGHIFLAGESAGGNLALLLAQRALTEGVRIPDAMGLMSPAVDLRTNPDLLQPTTHADPTLSPNRILEMMSAYGLDYDPADPSISPLFGVFEGLPPTFITTGTRDMLLSMCLRLERQMRRTGVAVECRVWDSLWHVFEYYDGFPEAEESLREIATFLNDKAVNN